MIEYTPELEEQWERELEESGISDHIVNFIWLCMAKEVERESLIDYPSLLETYDDIQFEENPQLKIF